MTVVDYLPAVRFFDDERGLHNWARTKLTLAKLRGEVVPATVCEGCGASGKVIHGHHTDYSRPLDVQWLCVDCHHAAHRGAVSDAELRDMILRRGLRASEIARLSGVSRQRIQQAMAAAGIPYGRRRVTHLWCVWEPKVCASCHSAPWYAKKLCLRCYTRQRYAASPARRATQKAATYRWREAHPEAWRAINRRATAKYRATSTPERAAA